MESQCKSRDVLRTPVERGRDADFPCKGPAKCFAGSLASQAGRCDFEWSSFDVTPSFQVRRPGASRAAGRYSRTIELGDMRDIARGSFGLGMHLLFGIMAGVGCSARVSLRRRGGREVEGFGDGFGGRYTAADACSTLVYPPILRAAPRDTATRRWPRIT